MENFDGQILLLEFRGTSFGVKISVGKFRRTTFDVQILVGKFRILKYRETLSPPG